jgi:hypothetical protein
MFKHFSILKLGELMKKDSKKEELYLSFFLYKFQKQQRILELYVQEKREVIFTIKTIFSIE